jgi:hypothetical protein
MDDQVERHTSKLGQPFNAQASWSPSRRESRLLFLLYLGPFTPMEGGLRREENKESERSLSPCTAASRALSQWARKRISGNHWGDKEFF